jgi:hypothetical protein
LSIRLFIHLFIHPFTQHAPERFAGDTSGDAERWSMLFVVSIHAGFAWFTSRFGEIGALDVVEGPGAGQLLLASLGRRMGYPCIWFILLGLRVRMALFTRF